MHFVGFAIPVHVYVVYDFICPGLYHEYHGAFGLVMGLGMLSMELWW